MIEIRMTGVVVSDPREQIAERHPTKVCVRVNTLRKWMYEGRIYPAPKKIGGRFFVSPDAEYMD